MPQMSPMNWLYLFFYFISIYLIIMLFIYNILLFKKNFIGHNMMKKNKKFNFKW